MDQLLELVTLRVYGSWMCGDDECECTGALTAALAQDLAHIFFDIPTTDIEGRVGRPEHQRLVGGVHEENITVIVENPGARAARGAQLVHRDELLALQAATMPRPHVQDLDVHPVGLGARSIIPGRRLHSALDHNGGMSCALP